MTDTFHAVAAAPIAEYVAGQLIQFLPLQVDDYLPWCSELKAQRRAIGLKRLDAKMPAFDRWRAETWLDQNEPTLDDIMSLVRTVPGAKRVLALSLTKAGRPGPEAEQIIAAVPPYKIANLASDVSQLFPPMLPAALAGEGGPPNPPAGEGAG